MSSTLRSLLIILSLFTIITIGVIGLGSSLLSLLIAFIIAYMIFPLILKLEGKGLGRTPALVAIFTTLSLTILVIFVAIGPGLLSDGRTLLKELPESSLKAIQRVELFAERYGYQMDLSKEGIIDLVKESFQSLSTNSIKGASLALKNIFSNVTGVFLGIINLFMIPLFLFYVINDFEKITGKILSLIPKAITPKLSHYFEISNRVLSGYIRGQFLVAGILAILYAIGLSLVGLRFGFLIGLLTGFLSIIPYVGFTVGLLSSVLIALANYESASIFIGLFLVFGLVQSLEGLVITPKLVGNKVGLSAFATMLALIIGGNLLGLVGMLIAIPFAAVFKMVVSELISEYQQLSINK